MRTILRVAALIDAWFDNLRPEQRPLARALQQAVLAAGPGLVPSIKWGNLVFSHAGSHALAIVIHKDHANLQVFNGTGLLTRFPMLEGSGMGLRHLRLRYGMPLDDALVHALVRACLEDFSASAPRHVP